MVGYGAGAYQLTLLDRVGYYEHSDCGEKDLGEYPDAGPIPTGDGGNGPGNHEHADRNSVIFKAHPPDGEAPPVGAQSITVPE